MDFAAILDRASSIPLQRQLYEQWRSAVLHGRFRCGSRVPSTRALAESLGVSRSTVTGAYDQLLAEGYLEAAAGSGTFVCRRLPEELLEALSKRGGQAHSLSQPLLFSQFGKRLAAAPIPPEASSTNRINLSNCRPDLSRFPMREWRKLYAQTLRDSSGMTFDYARDTKGLLSLREAIAGYLARSRAVNCSADGVLIVNGSQQALDLCARLLLDPGDVVALEDPSYPGAREAFSAQGAKVMAIPVDSEGIVVSRLPPSGVKNVYVTPSHQFPSGASLSLSRRLELLAWARRSGTVILEDDYDSEYRYNGRPLPALQSMAEGAAVVYIGTFSKVLFPGLRIGYLVAPPSMTSVLERAKYLSDRQSSLLDQEVLARFIEQGSLERHIRRMRTLYASRRQTLITALEKHFSGKYEIHGDSAGMHVMVTLTTGYEDEEVMERAAQAGVQVGLGRNYYHHPHKVSGQFVLGFAALPDGVIRVGMERLRKALP